MLLARFRPLASLPVPAPILAQTRCYAGHNRWSQIKRAKGAKDVSRAKSYAKITKQIISSFRAGKETDPSLNPYLAAALSLARQVQMPKTNVDVALKKGMATLGIGGEKGAEDLESVVYEGLTSYGVAVVVQALTSNRAKTFAEIRHCFKENDGALTPVLYLFSKLHVSLSWRGVPVITWKRLSRTLWDAKQ
ncbi:transcriptional regulator-domain-containing protein [Chytridium lagenaria]|nr:transcriptional regulator-domain-containing protein [Chytridium lagenaria]